MKKETREISDESRTQIENWFCVEVIIWGWEEKESRQLLIRQAGALRVARGTWIHVDGLLV